MPDQFNLKDIYEQNLNFLIGAGASHGFLPTLALEIKDDDGKKHTFETLAKIFESNSEMKCLLFMLYYRECIKPGLPYAWPKGVPAPPRVPVKEAVISEYKNFINTLVHVLDRQKDSAKKANIFTTNYDNCIETACEELLTQRVSPFYVNDGSSGFQKRIFHTKNFNNRVINKGAFGRYDQTIPQINILHAHGSIHWEKGYRDRERKGRHRGKKTLCWENRSCSNVGNDWGVWSGVLASKPGEVGEGQARLQMATLMEMPAVHQPVFLSWEHIQSTLPILSHG